MHFFDANAHAESKPQRRLRSIHVPRNPSVGIQASNFGRIKPPSRIRRIHVHEIQASESKLQISAAPNLQAGFIVSTSTESMLRNPRFQFRQRRTYCYLHAGFVASTSTESKLPFSISFVYRCDRSTIAFLLYTFVGNDGRRTPALTRRKVGARAFTHSARSHLACPLPQSN